MTVPVRSSKSALNGPSPAVPAAHPRRSGHGKRPRSPSSSWGAAQFLATVAAAILLAVYICISGYMFLLFHPPRSTTLPTRAATVNSTRMRILSPPKPAAQDKPSSQDEPDHVVQPPVQVQPRSSTEQHHPDSDQLQAIENAEPPPPWVPFAFDFEAAEATLARLGPQAIRQVLAAYIEPPLQDTIPGTGSRGNMADDRDHGVPPQFVVPLPLRSQGPSDLKMYEYPRLQTCQDMPAKFPVDRGLEYDQHGDPIVWNVGNEPLPDNHAEQEAPYCPVEADPFLPWIHDVFPSPDGTKIHFIAQNKRRCQTGKNYDTQVHRMVPQATLMQPISVQRLSEEEARLLAPNLWQAAKGDEDDLPPPPRYRLAPLEESSLDGMFTRFICRFHGTLFTHDGAPQTVVLGETLSGYDFNYELVAYRKGKGGATLLTPKGKDTLMFWTSNIRFYCPVPQDEALRQAVASGATVLSDGTATLHVDVIPIRTSARYDEMHLTPGQIGPTASLPRFNATHRWGPKNVLPRVEASGRWANIPICRPPRIHGSGSKEEKRSAKSEEVPTTTTSTTPKPHLLSACLWASAEFKTRGQVRLGSTDTQKRLEEWLEYHLMVGFDHFYVYDNSGAHSNETSLKGVLDKYADKVTRIDWPSIVCNNNIPAHDSCGERSSQYAAENSCRTRYAPFTEWIAVFDTDEYLVPMGQYDNLRDVLQKASQEGTNILSMRSSRGRLRIEASDEIYDGEARAKSANATFLEAYNCDSAGIPKPSWGDRARKQIYRTDYVLYHFVHYSTVTRGYLSTYREVGPSWRRGFSEQAPSERVTDEWNEAVMVHTKTLNPDMTSGYRTRCRYDYGKKWQGCWVAYPWPDSHQAPHKNEHNAEGMEYNCQINDKVDQYWVPKLKEAMKKRQESDRRLPSGETAVLAAKS